MTTVLTVQANLNGNASSMVAATSLAARSLKELQNVVKTVENTFDGFGNKVGDVVAGKLVAATRAIGAMAQKAAAFLSVLGSAAIGAGVQFFNAASRVEELDLAMRAVSKSSHVTYEAMRDTALAVKNQGIEMATAQELATQFARAHLKLANAAKVARVAQDLAVISGQNSTAVTQQLMYAIVKQDTEMLRQAGITANSEEAFKAYAASIGKTVGQLTGAERQQAFVNLILAEGAKVAGTYEAAMHSASKVIRSMPRLFNDISVALGGPLLAAFGPAIVSIYEMTKAFDKAVSVGGSLRPLIDSLTGTIKRLAQPLTDQIKNWTVVIERFRVGEDTIQRLNSALLELSDYAQPIAALTGFIVAFGAKGIPVIGLFLPAINPLIAAFAGLVATTPELRAVFSKLFAEIKKSLPGINSMFETASRGLVTELVPALETLVTAITPLIPAFLDLGTALLGGLFKLLPPVTAMVTTLVRAVTPLVEWMSKLPQPVLTAGAALVALQAAGVPIAGIVTQIGKAMVGVIATMAGANTGLMTFNDHLLDIRTAPAGVVGKLGAMSSFLAGPWGLAIGGAIAILGLLATTAFPQAAANADELTASLDRQTGAFTDATRASILKALQDSGAADQAHALGLNLGTVVDAALGSADAIDVVNSTLEAHKQSLMDAAGDTQSLADAYGTWQEESDALVAAIGGQNQAIKDARKDWAQWAEVSDAVGDQYKNLQDTVAQTTTTMQQNGVTADTTTAAYQSNKAALDQVVTASTALIEASKNSTEGFYAVKGATETAAKAVYDAAYAMTGEKEAALDMTAALLNVPKSVVTNVLFSNYKDVYNKLMNVQALLRDVTGNKSLHIATGAGGQGGLVMENGGIVAAANGLIRQSQTVKGGSNGAGILWGEPETGWESYISGKKSQKQRSAAIWAETGRRLGLMGDSGDSGGTGGVVALSPEDRKLLRQIAEKEFAVMIGDRDVAQANKRGSEQLSQAGAF